MILPLMDDNRLSKLKLDYIGSHFANSIECRINQYLRETNSVPEHTNHNFFI